MEQRVRGMLSYLFGWIGGLVILVAFKDNSDDIKFHACQSIVISAMGWLVSIVFNNLPIPFLSYVGFVISILIAVLQILGMVKAYREEEYELPVISDLTRAIFKGILNK